MAIIIGALRQAFLLPGFVICSLFVLPAATTNAQVPSSDSAKEAEVGLRILRAEDERRWDNELLSLLSDGPVEVRRRAALAAGRIGDPSAVPKLIELLSSDPDPQVIETVLFALGEIESAEAVPALLKQLGDQTEPIRRARALEALGKIAASLPADQKPKLELTSAIVDALNTEVRLGTGANPQIISLGLIAVLRARGENAGPVIQQFLNHPEARIRADAANVLTRLRLRAGLPRLRELLAEDPDPIVRANSARALGAAEDTEALALLERALNDPDLRVRVSALRSLGLLRNPRSVQPLLNRSTALTKGDLRSRPTESNEILEIASALGRVLRNTDHQQALAWLKRIRHGFSYAAPELEIAFARISPAGYLQDLGSGLPATRQAQRLLAVHWKAGASVAEGLGEIAAAPPNLKDRNLIVSNAELLLSSMLQYRIAGQRKKGLKAVHSEFAIPSMLRALAAFKPDNLAELLRSQLGASDVIVRATAAELLGQLPAEDASAKALITALAPALKDEMNDAALAILDALGRQRTDIANEAIKTALTASDQLVRMRAVNLLKNNGAGDFSDRIGHVQSKFTAADYRRALARTDKSTIATVRTVKGSFAIEFLAEKAPLTVENFIQLARRGFFNGQTIPRVVPNFVIQAGDPRGDQNGGPGYAIRCEINLVPYERATVGMALSGKDTGGSQWFVTHSPQPHLDGGYTVFGQVISGMEVVDKLVRGDLIHSVTITERPSKQREITRRGVQ